MCSRNTLEAPKGAWKQACGGTQSGSTAEFAEAPSTFKCSLPASHSSVPRGTPMLIGGCQIAQLEERFRFSGSLSIVFYRCDTNVIQTVCARLLVP